MKLTLTNKSHCCNSDTRVVPAFYMLSMLDVPNVEVCIKCGHETKTTKTTKDKELDKKTYKGFSNSLKEEKNKGKIEEISMHEMFQVAEGVLIANEVKGIAEKKFTNPNKQPATIEDMQELKNNTESRYLQINNYRPGPNGEPYYFGYR